MTFLESSMFLFRHSHFDLYDYYRILFTGIDAASLNKIRINSSHCIVFRLHVSSCF